VLRFRITREEPGDVERTWVLLPDEPSAVMQAQELARQEKTARVRVYREETGSERELLHDLAPRTSSPS
jgi:hypothetical protein